MTNAEQPTATKRSGNATKVLLGITAMAVIGFVCSVGAVAYLLSGEDTAEVADGSFLSVKLSGQIPDAPVVGAVVFDPSDIPPLTSELSAALKKAAVDDRIDGLYLRLDGVSAGWGGMEELRSGILAFKEADKPCVAYAEVFDNSSYYLASACETILLAPGGIALIPGLSAQHTYYAETFEKMGIVAEFEHVGDFKSAVEPYERSGPSEAASEAMDHLLDGLYDQFVQGIADGRGWTISETTQRIDHPKMSARSALANGWVDGLAFPDQLSAVLPTVREDGFLDRLNEPVGSEIDDDWYDEHYTSMSEYLKGVRSEWNKDGDKIAVIHAEGPIMSGESGGGLFADSVLADKTFASWMREAREDDEVKAIVIRVNSPGGSGLASDMMWRNIKRAQSEGKPVVVSMGNYAASGGYYISAPADWIVAQPTTLTGSIGVFGGKMNLKGGYEKLGMHLHTYKRGAESDLFSSTSSFSENGRAAYRGFLTDFYEIFLERVAEGRGMNRDEVHEIAQGRVWTGSQALKHGLVDELGGLDVAIKKAAELAELEEPGLVRLPKQRDFFELLLEDLQKNASAPKLEVTVQLPIAQELMEELSILEAVMAEGPVVMLPGNLKISD